MKFFSLLFLLIFVFKTTLFTESKENSDDVKLVPKGTVIEKNYYAFGDDVRISGIIKGNLYVASSKFILDGTVEGNVYAICMTAKISGKIANSLQLIAAHSRIEGTIEHNANIFSGDTEIYSDAKIFEQLNIASGNLYLYPNSDVGGLIGCMGNLKLSGNVFGDTHVAVGRFLISDSADMNGNITYWSKNKLIREKKAQIKGKIIQKVPAGGFQERMRSIFGQSFPTYLIFRLLSFFSLFFLGLFFIYYTPHTMHMSVSVIQKRPIRTFFFGVLAFVLIPLIIIGLLVTMIGIPLAFNLLALYLIHLYVVKIYSIFSVGVILFRKISSTMPVAIAYFLSLLIYFIITFIPIVGWIVTLVFLFLGFGSFFIARAKFTKILRLNVKKSW